MDTNWQYGAPNGKKRVSRIYAFHLGDYDITGVVRMPGWVENQWQIIEWERGEDFKPMFAYGLEPGTWYTVPIHLAQPIILAHSYMKLRIIPTNEMRFSPEIPF
jgi:hypothetical protein